MNIRRINKNEFDCIYKNLMPYDFPADEIKEYSIVNKMLTDGKYIGYRLIDGEKEAAYALLCYDNPKDYVLLDYYAVDSSIRGKGYGSQCLSLLKEEFSESRGIVLECENPDFAADENDLKIRTRRIDFYKKNGFYLTDVRSSLFGVEFVIMACNLKSEKNFTVSDLDKIYRVMFYTDTYSKHVKIG